MRLKGLLVLFTLVLLSGCSKDDESAAPVVQNFSDLVVTTKQPILASNNLSFSTGGSYSFSLEDFGYEKGVCYNQTGNPTVLDQVNSAYQNSGNSFDINIDELIFGATYYVKAYVRKFSTGEVKYGNQLSIQIPFSLTTGIVKNISCTGFSVDVNVGSVLASNVERGICYSTSQNPTVSNSTYSSGTSGSGDFTINVVAPTGSPFYHVSANTTYYLKSYVKIGATYYYGNQVTFKTAGYIAGSGGFVFYDKGEVTNGWRYLEAAPTYLTTSSYQYFQWGNSNCGYSFLSGIGNLIGDGSTNSTLIKNYCNYTNIAATMCKNVSLNGQNDWFLPSMDEAKELYKLKFTNLISITDNFITSSQSSNSLCFVINSSTGNPYTADKYNGYRAWQIRRF